MIRFRDLVLINSAWCESTVLEILHDDESVNMPCHEAEDCFGNQKVYCFNGNMVILNSWVGGQSV